MMKVSILVSLLVLTAATQVMPEDAEMMSINKNDSQTSDSKYKKLMVKFESLVHYEKFLNAPVEDQILLAFNKDCKDLCQKDIETLFVHVARLKQASPKIRFVITDLQNNTEIREHLGLFVLHRVFYVHEGTEIDVTLDSRESDREKLIDTLLKSIARRPIRIDSPAVASMLATEQDVTYILYSDMESEVFSEFRVTAKLTDQAMYHTDSSDVAAALNLPAHGFYYIDKDLRVIRMFKPLDSDNMYGFVQSCKHSLDSVISGDTLSSYIAQDIPLLAYHSADDRIKIDLIEALTSIESTVRSNFVVTQLQDIKSDKSMAGLYGMCRGYVTDSRLVVCIVHRSNDAGIKRYVLEIDTIDKNQLMLFVHDFIDGNLVAHKELEELAEAKTNGVYNLNGESFKGFLTETSSGTVPAVVYFYKSRCQECETFNKLYEKLAQEYTNQGLKFARINYQKNEIEGKPLSLEFPLIQYISADNDGFGNVHAGNWNEDAVRVYIEKVLTNTESSASDGRTDIQKDSKKLGKPELHGKQLNNPTEM